MLINILSVVNVLRKSAAGEKASLIEYNITATEYSVAVFRF